MHRWTGRVAIVTGASAGIGAAITQQLVDHGVTVVALARRTDKIREAVGAARKEAEELGRPKSNATHGKLYPHQCDVSKEEDILKTFQWVKDNLGGADILVNNAGVGGMTGPTGTNTSEWRRIFDVNVLGLSICTREAVNSMKERGVDDGHIIHIGSLVGHLLPQGGEYSMYSASKHAVRALTEGLRKDLAASNSKIKVSCISPGMVKTEFLVALSIIPDVDKVFQQVPHILSTDVAEAAIFILGTPPHVQIHDIIIKPIGEKM